MVESETNSMIIYINDIVKDIQSTIRLFADDTCFFTMQIALFSLRS